MNKDLEKEYKELMTEDVPDLWGRIEEGLEPKKATTRVSFWRKYRAWGMAAAACLCLAVVAPMIYGVISDDGLSKSDSFGASCAPSSMYYTSDGSMYENAGGDDISPEENHLADWSDANLGETEPNGEYDDGVFTITAKVMEILEEEGKNVYLVQIMEVSYADWSEGDIIRLYELEPLDETLTKGETYLLGILIQKTDEGTEEYFIYDH